MQNTNTMLLISGALLLGACGSGGEASITQDCPTSSTLTYDNFGRGFMNKYCVTCHGANVTGASRHDAPEEDVFDTVDEIRADKDELYEVVVTKHSMPDKAAADKFPSDSERTQFGDWLACDAP